MVDLSSTPARRSVIGRGARLTAATTALVVGVIHLFEAPEYLEGTSYLGVLFVIGGLTLIGVAASLFLDRFTPPAWLAGALVCIGMFVGGILSRTVGLPGFKETEWEPLLLASLLLEAVFLIVWASNGRWRWR